MSKLAELPTKTISTEVLPPEKPIPFKPSERDVNELIHKRLVFGENGDSLKLDEKTPIEEFMPMLDWLCNAREKSGFLIGDFLNQGNALYKDKMQTIMAQTGRSLTTLEIYASIAKLFPPSKRVATLGWTYYQDAASIARSEEAGGKAKAQELLQLAAKGGEDGKPMATRDFKRVVAAAAPAKKKPRATKPGRTPKARKVATPKAAKSRPILAEEEAALNDLYKRVLPALESAVSAALKALDSTPAKKDGLPLIEVIKQATNADKKAFVKDAPAKADVLRIFNMIQVVEDKVGY